MLAVGIFVVVLIVGLLCYTDRWLPEPPPEWYRRILVVIAWPLALVMALVRVEALVLPLLVVSGLFWGVVLELFLTSLHWRTNDKS
jgi:hypothetical protein